jgi:protein disulfide-isomerase
VKNLRFAALLCFLCFLVSAGVRADLNWLTDLHRAQEQAKADHKLLLINFTGSDWCPWCIRLDREVFSKPEFASYAKDHLVLFMADFPRAKPLTDDVRKQNQQLANQFDVQGFPTIIVLNEQGKQVGELGYVPGGAGAFIEQLKKLEKG